MHKVPSLHTNLLGTTNRLSPDLPQPTSPVSAPAIHSHPLHAVMESAAGHIPTVDLVEDGARSDDLEFRVITKLLHVLQDRSLFGGHRANVPVVDYFPPVTGSDARRQLKILRQLPFVLVRNHEIVAALSRVLPSGIVGVLSATLAEGDDQNDGLVHLSRNSRHV